MQDAPDSQVTGANKGIGLDTVRRLAGAGCRGYLGSRNIQRRRGGEEAIGARRIQQETRPTSRSVTPRRSSGGRGRLDVMVNNAGMAGASPHVDAFR